MMAAASVDLPRFSADVPTDVQRHLFRRAKAFRENNFVRVVRTPADRDDEAKQVAKAAQALLEAVRKWYGRYSDAADNDEARESVETMLNSWRQVCAVTGDADDESHSILSTFVSLDPDEYRVRAPRFGGEELAQVRSGFDPVAIGRVLLGLQLHMRAVAELAPVRDGARRKSREIAMVQYAARLFRMAGLKVVRPSKKSPSLFSETCAEMFRIAGIGDWDATSDGKIDSLIRRARVIAPLPRRLEK